MITTIRSFYMINSKTFYVIRSTAIDVLIDSVFMYVMASCGRAMMREKPLSFREFSIMIIPNIVFGICRLGCMFFSECTSLTIIVVFTVVMSLFNISTLYENGCFGDLSSSNIMFVALTLLRIGVVLFANIYRSHRLANFAFVLGVVLFVFHMLVRFACFVSYSCCSEVDMPNNVVNE